MIINDDVKNEWDIRSAEHFEKEFNIAEPRENNECDDDYIRRHLEADKRYFKITFVEDPRGNQYEDYWCIEEMNQSILKTKVFGINDIQIEMQDNGVLYSGCLTESDTTNKKV
jgi:hypothetical protein